MAEVMMDGFWRGRTVLVTGNTGFKGAWLSVWLLRLGARVVGLSREVPTVPSLFDGAGLRREVETVFADVADTDAVRRTVERHGPSIIFHLAAQPLVRQSYRDPVDTFRSNVLGTLNVLEAIRGVGGVDAAVLITTDKCYEPDPNGLPHREGDPLGGPDPYASSKACAELVTRAYRDSFLREDGVPVATARAGNVIGGGDWTPERLVPDVVRAAASGEELVLRSPDAVRPWQHVLDCTNGYLMLAELLVADPSAAAPWNFGPDPAEARTVSWVVETLADRLPSGLEWRVEPGSPSMPESPRLLLDARMARSRLGWFPRWTAEEAVRRTADWFVEVAEGKDAREVTERQLDDFKEEQ